jgi:hypothetical protein
MPAPTGPTRQLLLPHRADALQHPLARFRPMPAGAVLLAPTCPHDAPPLGHRVRHHEARLPPHLRPAPIRYVSHVQNDRSAASNAVPAILIHCNRRGVFAGGVSGRTFTHEDAAPAG